MTYDDFCNQINEYIEVYNKGLKKQANTQIKSVIDFLDNLESSKLDAIFRRFLSEYCDDSIWDSLSKRGNGDIPFALKNRIKLWLIPRCKEKKMPELRWYYELYHNHSQGVEDYDFLIKCLDDAYLSDKCDQKTVDLLFDSYLDVLGWGAHHFPDGCIIETSTRKDCIINCKKIMTEKTVNEKLLMKYKYYQLLYECYDMYVEDGRKRDFNLYLSEANIDFYDKKAFG